MIKNLILLLFLCGMLVSCGARNTSPAPAGSADLPYREKSAGSSSPMLDYEAVEQAIAPLTQQQRETLAQIIANSADWNAMANRLFLGERQEALDEVVCQYIERQCKDSDIRRAVRDLSRWWKHILNDIAACEFIMQYHLTKHPEDYQGWNMVYYYMLFDREAHARKATEVFNRAKKYGIHQTRHGKFAGRLAEALQKRSTEKYYNNIGLRRAAYDDFIKKLPDFTAQREADFNKVMKEYETHIWQSPRYRSWLFPIKHGPYATNLEWMISDEDAPEAYRNLSVSQRRYLAELIVRARDWQLAFIEAGNERSDHFDEERYKQLISYVLTHCKDKDILRIFSDPKLSIYFWDNSVICADIVCRYYLVDHPEDAQAWNMLKYFSLLQWISDGYLRCFDSLIFYCFAYDDKWQCGIQYLILRNKLTEYPYGRELLFLAEGQVFPLTWETFLFPDTVKTDERKRPDSCYFVANGYCDRDSSKIHFPPHVVRVLRKAVANKNSLRKRRPRPDDGMCDYGCFFINGKAYYWLGRNVIFPDAHPDCEVRLPSYFNMKRKEKEEMDDAYCGFDKRLEYLLRFFKQL